MCLARKRSRMVQLTEEGRRKDTGQTINTILPRKRKRRKGNRAYDEAEVGDEVK